MGFLLVGVLLGLFLNEGGSDCSCWSWELGVFFAVGFCPGWMGLAKEAVLLVFCGEEIGRAGQSVLSLLATRSSGLAGKAFIVGWEAVLVHSFLL